MRFLSKLSQRYKKSYNKAFGRLYGLLRLRSFQMTLTKPPTPLPSRTFIDLGALLWAFMLLGAVLSISPAYAYKVKYICETTTTKNGPVEKCRTVLDTTPQEPPAKEKEKEGKKEAKPGH
jgi:hypothetical protein